VQWFVQQNIQPVRITYEALSDKPQATLAIVLSALDQDPAIAGTVKPRTTKLADSESHDWENRFRIDELNH
jgi:LPS sulfotransferase NodH